LEEFRFLHNISFDAKIIAVIGELKVLKGQRDFILAAQIIAQKFPEAFFVIVGKENAANQKFRRELKRLVSVFRLENQFLFLDWIENLAPLFAAMDIFVSASHSESFGLVILEAMASKCAIISTETEGAKELLQNNETALLIPIKNPIEIANAAEKLLSDDKKRQSLAENAQIFARKQFSLLKMIEETENLYQEILKK
jgi:glycosyltransferase involved in cell wall biosynthesis